MSTLVFSPKCLISCTSCATRFVMTEEILKNNGQRLYQGVLECCGAPVCDDCLNEKDDDDCPFCKKRSEIVKVKHTCFHHYTFENGIQSFWTEYYYYCVGLESFQPSFHHMLYRPVMEWTNDYSIKLNWRNIHHDMMILYRKFQQFQQMNAFVCSRPPKSLGEMMTIYKGALGVKNLLNSCSKVQLKDSRLQMMNTTARRLAFEHVFSLDIKTGSFYPEHVYYNRFFNKIVKRIVARLAAKY